MNNAIQNNYNESSNVSLKDYLHIIKKGYVWILIITAFITMLGVIYDTYFKSPPLYESTKTVILNTNSDQIATLIALAKDPLILDKVNQELGLNKSADTLAGQISISSVNNSQVVQFKVLDLDPKTAIDIANTTVNIFQSELASLLNFTAIKIVPDSNIGENVKQIEQSKDRTIYAFVIGLLISIGFVLLLDYLDNSVKTQRDVEETLGVPLIGVVSKMNHKNAGPTKKFGKENEVGSEKISVN